jgi:radical SAM protein with 4Fe4S-binding SPASM domain
MNDPFYVQWHITNLCNLRCRHCYQDDFSHKGDLDWLQLKQISDNILCTLKNWGRAACIHLTGGEPLLKPELLQLLEELDRSPEVHELGIITNGVLLDRKRVEELSPFSKLKRLKISMDGADAAVNDAIRPEGTFRRVIENVSEIKRSGRFETQFMITALRKNFRSIPSLIDLCQDLGIDGLIIERFIPWGRGEEIKDELLGRKEWKELVGMLFEVFSIDLSEGECSPYQAFEVMFNGDETELLGAPCVIGTDGICVMPEGSVFPCRRFPVSIGNLLDESLNQIWTQSDILRQLREKKNLQGQCGTCQWKDCRGCRSLALFTTGNYLEEDPHCYRSADPTTLSNIQP